MRSAFDADGGATAESAAAATESGAAGAAADAADRIVGVSTAARRLRTQVKAAARDELPVWIAGPPGGDAAQVARAIHRQSPRRRWALVVLDCAGVPAPLLGRALLGCARGVYPALPEAHPGALHRAAGGSLLIASAEVLPPGLLDALLRALDTGRFRSEGGEEQPLSARILLASAGGEAGAPSTGAEGAGGALLAGAGEAPPLGQRLHHPMRLAPLCQRRADIPLLAAEELRRMARAGGPAIRLAADARAALETEPWPGDMAELRERLRNALPLCDGPTLDAEALLLAGPEPLPFKLAKRAFESRYVRALLRRCRGNISRAARLAGKDRKDFYEVIRRNGVNPRDFRRR